MQHQRHQRRRRIEFEAHIVQFLFGGHQIRTEAAQVFHQYQRMLLLFKNQTDMNAQKSLSPRLSRRNISVAGNAAHSVIAFILMVCACSSVSLAPSNWLHGMSFSMSQRTCSSDLNSSGYNIAAFANKLTY